MGNTIRYKRWRLLSAATELLGRTQSFEDTMDVLRNSAQAILQSDGVTVVTLLGDAVVPLGVDGSALLTEGQRFQIDQCVSRLAITERTPVVILDIPNDPRSAVLSAFVASMVMAPIGLGAPVAAIGAFWRIHKPVEDDALDLLGMLARAAGATLERLADAQNTASQHIAA